MPLSLETDKHGLEMFFKPWQVEALRVLWSQSEGANSATVWKEVNNITQISRASIINYLNDMVDEEILNYTEVSGKGGYHRVYQLDLSESQLREHLAKLFLAKLIKEYPEATKKDHKRNAVKPLDGNTITVYRNNRRIILGKPVRPFSMHGNQDIWINLINHTLKVTH